MLTARKLATFLTAAAACLPVAACGEDDVSDSAGDAGREVREKANEVEGSLDDLSKEDLREARDDVEDAAREGGKDAKREARELERKIERELNSRD
jgi:hypothetical protein